MIDVEKLTQLIEKIMLLVRIWWDRMKWKTDSCLKDFEIFALDTN